MKILLQSVSVLFLTLSFSCTSSNNEYEETDEAPVEVVIEEDFWVIDEHQINSIPVTTYAIDEAEEAEVEADADAEAAAAEAAEEAEAEEEIEAEEELEAEEEAYEILAAEELHAALIDAEYEAMENTYVVQEVAIPLEETQTVVAYNKKDQEIADLQVISNADGEIEQIIFTDKKHKDVYDVQAGLSGKEVKRLRKEIKHMEKKGQVFLYNDESNVMYLMDAQNMVGDEIVAADIETMEVSAIIWKDKKHHKNK